MKLAYTLALGLCAALGSATAGTAPASAQGAAAGQLGKQEREALFALQTALQNRNYGGAAAALPVARSAARSGHTRYLVASLQLRLGIETSDLAMQSAAIDAIIESGAAPAAELPKLYQNQGALAASTGQYERAERAFARWLELAPANAEALVALAEAKSLRGKGNEAVGLLDRAIAARRTSGQIVPESWYQRALKQAFDVKLPGAAQEIGRGLLVAYPRPENWRDVLLGYRDLQQQDPALRLDVMRLMRAAGALAGERDYLALATGLSEAGLPVEAKSVLDSGVAARMVDPAKAPAKDLLVSLGKRAAADRKAIGGLETKANADLTGAASLAAADAYLAQASYVKAADLYTAALRKGGVDSALVQNRLGMALGLAGRKAEAETALRAVTGPRAALANLWLLWLQRSPAA